jgi:pyruvate,water dikinase
LAETYQALGRILEPYFGEETELIKSQLISGVTGNMTMETNQRLWDLARLAQAAPAVREILTTISADQVPPALEQIAEGPAFLTALERFLTVYGHREIRMDIVYPTWKEDPAPVFSFLRGYLGVSQPQDPYQQEERLAREAQETAHQVEERLSRDWKGRWLILPLFRWLLRHCQYSTRERDTMHFHMTASFPIFRSILHELGRRWSAAGWIRAFDDIYYLHLEEMMTMATGPRRMQETVEARRREWELDRTRTWPIIIRGTHEIYAEESIPSEGVLSGVGGSPGRVQGPARIVRGPEDFSKLRPGDILVAPLTTPVWTPLFGIAKGLVADVGGLLSHGAIVAREYGIPAVMGTQVATRLLSDGQMITVDGGQGRVYLEKVEERGGSE